METALPGFPKRRGKVRDVYDLGDGRLLMIATDRISAYDWILPNGIPDKGRVLTGISTYFFGIVDFNNHLISTNLDDAGLNLSSSRREDLAGRVMLVRKTEVYPFECVVRGYLSGSSWREYRESGKVCGVDLPPGLVESARIDPIFTPATKAETGHDENVPFSRMVEVIGDPVATALAGMSEVLYNDAAEYARARGLILADTKFEWGLDPETDKVHLVDEILTPDSSRYWPLDAYAPGGPQPSFDKQYVRDWLDASGWDKASPPPPLPDDVVAKTRDKYVQCYEMLTGESFPWK